MPKMTSSEVAVFVASKRSFGKRYLNSFASRTPSSVRIQWKKLVGGLPTNPATKTLAGLE